MIFLSKLSLFSITFGTDFQVRNLDVLGKVLGSILASISDHVGVQNDVRMASNNHHEKRCQHEPNMSPTWPQEASQNGLMDRRRGGVAVQDSPLDRSYA